MGEIWDALVDLDRALPIWRYVATAGGSIGIYRLVARAWRRLHRQEKPFRCGPLVWKKTDDGDVFAGVSLAGKSYPF